MSKLRARVTVLPEGTQPDESLLAWIAHPDSPWDIDQCNQHPQNCVIWMMDLNHDGSPEAVMLVERDHSVYATVLSRGSHGWARQGDLLRGPQTLDEWVQRIKAEPPRLAPPVWSDVMLGADRVEFDAH